jgi:hypothetical protein
MRWAAMHREGRSPRAAARSDPSVGRSPRDQRRPGRISAVSSDGAPILRPRIVTTMHALGVEKIGAFSPNVIRPSQLAPRGRSRLSQLP